MKDVAEAARGTAALLREIGKYIFERQSIAHQLTDRDSDLLKRKCLGFLPFHLERGNPERSRVEAEMALIVPIVAKRSRKWDQNQVVFEEFNERLGKAYAELQAAWRDEA